LLFFPRCRPGGVEIPPIFICPAPPPLVRRISLVVGLSYLPTPPLPPNSPPPNLTSQHPLFPFLFPLFPLFGPLGGFFPPALALPDSFSFIFFNGLGGLLFRFFFFIWLLPGSPRSLAAASFRPLVHFFVAPFFRDNLSKDREKRLTITWTVGYTVTFSLFAPVFSGTHPDPPPPPVPAARSTPVRTLRIFPFLLILHASFTFIPTGVLFPDLFCSLWSRTFTSFQPTVAPFSAHS